MPRKPKTTTATIDAILKSEGFQDVIKLLEKDHPLHLGLDHTATIEQRANYQIKVQEYESVMIKLRAMSKTAQASTVESTYEEPSKK